ncbi:MAG: ComF family protein [Candidatus Moranbacteria bacterium]|nr:ComF family protein [Candidatus Moranbacteria bacterium]
MFINTAVTSFLLSLKKQALDTLFPFYCLGCEKKGALMCQTCLTGVPLQPEQHCPVCARHITPQGQVCSACHDRGKTALDSLFVASRYHDTILPRVIHTFKYRFIPETAKPLGVLLTTALLRSSLPLPDALIAVPLHPRRLRFRGFNQSALLAQEIVKTLTPGVELPFMPDVLIRTRYTKPQMKTESRIERLENLKNAFAIVPNTDHLITGKRLWLIDDVATTGTTLEECARVLKTHGAASVTGIVLAR